MSLCNHNLNISAPISLKVTLTPDYPESVPLLEIPLRSGVLSSQQHDHLMTHLEEMVSDTMYSRSMPSKKVEDFNL